MEDLRGRLDSLPIIVREQTMRQQRLIGRQSMGEFNDKVYETVRRVPRGKVVSYGQVARLIGQPRKARFVGYAMHGNPDPWDCAAQTGIPCHRVVFKDGGLCKGFAFGRTTGKAYCGGRDVLGRRARRHAGVPMGRPERRGRERRRNG